MPFISNSGILVYHSSLFEGRDTVKDCRGRDRDPYYGPVSESNEVWQVVSTLARSGCQVSWISPKGGCEWGGVRFHEFWISFFLTREILARFGFKVSPMVYGETFQRGLQKGQPSGVASQVP